MVEPVEHYADHPTRSPHHGKATPGRTRVEPAPWAGSLLALQSQAGNTAVSGLLRSVQRDACLIPAQAPPYAGIGRSGAVGPGENFDANQRFAILDANFSKSKNKIVLSGTFDRQRSDKSGDQLFDPTHLRPHAAEIDHVVPKQKGGGNTELNAQVLGGIENVNKGTAYPWGPYSGARVYDPASQKIFNTRTAAKAGNADLTTLLSHFRAPYEAWVPK